MAVQRNLPDDFVLTDVGTHPDFVRRALVGGFWDDLVHSYSSTLDHFLSALIGIVVLFVQKGTALCLGNLFFLLFSVCVCGARFVLKGLFI
jgi:hypothetical protein